MSLRSIYNLIPLYSMSVPLKTACIVEISLSVVVIYNSWILWKSCAWKISLRLLPWELLTIISVVEKICYNGSCILNISLAKPSWGGSMSRYSGHSRGSKTTALQREDPVIGQPHNPALEETQIRHAKARSWMKVQAANTQDKPAQIFSQGMS